MTGFLRSNLCLDGLCHLTGGCGGDNGFGVGGDGDGGGDGSGCGGDGSGCGGDVGCGAGGCKEGTTQALKVKISLMTKISIKPYL